MNHKRQPSNRQLKVGQQIRFLISNFFIKEDFIFETFDSKNLTIVDVILSPDLKNAKIFISTNSVSANKVLINELNNKSKLIQTKIASNLTSKFTPKIKFFFDNSFEYSNKINNILETIK
ncbi:30S ribosome-binding factor RbfA [Alphaproteobacteria bacterium]|nr:30S ribosome-binding factor RbfA [Alphaproteobacteria bacterium]